jgi:hypothetical protein
MYREWKKTGLPKVLYTNLEATRLRDRPWNRWQDEVRVDRRLDGGIGYITEKNRWSSWEPHGITAFCTCQWKEMNANILCYRGFPPKTNFLVLLVLTVGTYSEGNLLVVYEIRRQVLPTAPSPTTTHLMVCIVEGYLYCTSICNRTKNATN